MKKRLLSMCLVLIMVLGLIPGTALAASSEEEALGEIDIYYSGEKLQYLSINGIVRPQNYTYYNYVNANGQTKEIPAYCVNPNDAGVPQTVRPGESIKYLAEEKASDPKVTGIIANGYPNRGLSELGLENKLQAFYATKMALWCYLLSNWDINNLKVNPNLTGLELTRAQKILAAAKNIYQRGTTWTENLAPNITCTPDRDVAYDVTIDGRAYKQQVFTFWSKTWVCDYTVGVSFTDPDSVPAGTRIVDMNNNDITKITTSGTGNGYAGQFKVIYPAESIAGKTGSVQLSFDTDVYQYAIFYAVCAEVDKYGNLQNYMVDTDPTRSMKLSAYSNYAPGTSVEFETGLRIIKYETGTTIPLSGAMFEVIDPNGATVGTFTTDSNGEIVIPLTTVGNYTVFERSAPSFYLISENPAQNVTVVYDEIAEVVFENEPYGNLRIEKVSNTGMNLPGAVVSIEHIESGQTYSAETNSAGCAVFNQIQPGAYLIREVSVPTGWLLDTTTHTTNVLPGETSTYTLVNEEKPGLRIIKYDRKNMLAMPDVTFEIFHDTVSLGKFRTDQFGEILLTDLQPGTYLAYEVDTGDDGYILNTTPQQIELSAGDGIRDLLFFNDVKPGMRLTKVDSSDPSKIIPNAVFEIKSVDGDYGPEEFITDQNGEIDLSALPEGAYVVTEKSCPGYIIDNAQRIIQLDANEDAEFVFTNSIRPTLRLVKYSSDGTPLKGVTFRIAKIEDGSHYLDRTTNASGVIEISDLDPGVYSVRETATLSDHILDTREHHVQLFPGRPSEIVLENQKRPNLTVWKFDADTGEPISDTVFVVRAADGHSVDEIRTGPDGSATLKNLLPGVFEISEKSVPSPYLLDAPDQLITLYPNRDRNVYFENHKKPGLTVEKVCSVTGDPLEGAKFQVFYASNDTTTGELNDLGIYYTDSNGQFTLSGLRDGWYKVVELESVPGYSIKEPGSQEFYIKGGESKTIRFENVPLSAIAVWKYDTVTGLAVEGARFQIKYLTGVSGTGGTVIGTYETSVNGSFVVTGLKEGTYIVEELSSGDGHVIDTSPQTVYISGKDQDVVQLYFGNAPKGSLLIKKVSASDNSPLSDVEFFVTDSNGTVIGNANGKFVTDSAGSILIEGIAPGTTLVVKETRAKDGYLLDNVPQTATIKAGQTITLEFRNEPLGNLIINKLSSADKKTPLEGVQFKITYADGKVVDAEGGKLSSNGIYFTDKNGQIILSGITGTIVVTEVESIPGYTIDENTRTQTVVVNPDDTQSLFFYNKPIGGITLIKVNEDDRSERIPNVTFEIRRAGNDTLVDTVTTDKQGQVFIPLEDGAYYAVETASANGFRLDATPHYFDVEDGKAPPLTITNKAFSGIILHKIDSVTGEGIYGVKFVLYDRNRNPIGEYETDDEGYIYIDDLESKGNGRFYLRELEAAEGYELDKEYKTVYVQPGRTVEIEWENTPITGQIQVYKYAAEYNGVTGTAPGAPLKGAVFEIVHERSGKVVDYITTDARGVAASKPLPLSRYKVVEVTAPPYWQIDPTVHDVTLEYPGQIIKLSAYDKPAELMVSITKRGNAEVLAGNQMRYDITVANQSNVDLESFYWHDRIPTDMARATMLTTGTYSARLNYRVLYKTNYSDYRVLASNLLTSNNYSFALNAIPMQAGEVVTEVYFDFGKVPVGFQSVQHPTLSVIVNGNAVNGYQLINRADVGGKYQGTWQTAQASWLTIIRKYWTTPDLPKTGY